MSTRPLSLPVLLLLLKGLTATALGSDARVFGQLVAVEAAERDRYARLLGAVRLPDGRSLNQEVVRAGSATRLACLKKARAG